MKRALIVLTVAACGGQSLAVETPQPVGPPRMRVVKCQPAIAAPRIPTRDHDDNASDVFGVGGLGVLEGGLLGGTLGPSAHTPMVAIGAATSTATIGDASIRRYLRQQVPQLRDCYGAQLAADPKLRGTVVATFAVAADGAVVNAQASGLHPKVAACVASAIGAIKFPKPPAAIAKVSYPFVFDFDVHAASSLLTGDEITPTAWTPFAVLGDPEIDAQRAATATRAAEAVLRARVPELEACFPRALPTGSLRAMLDVIGDGAITGVRVGGLGDVGAESCIAEVLADLQLVVPPGVYVELACDLSRGDARPWRVSPSAYARIDVARDAVRFGDLKLVPHAEDPQPLAGETTYLVVVEPAAPGELVELALAWASEGDATVIAVPDGPELAYVGAGRNAASVDEIEDSTVTPHPSLVIQHGNVRSCVDRVEDTAPIADRAKLDAMLRRFATRCRRSDCATTLGVAFEGDAIASELATVTTAARRAGFERVLLGAFSTCRVR